MDTDYFLKKVLPPSAAWLNKKPKRRGPAKSPDFIALDSSGHLHILECKGTQDSHRSLNSALGKGYAQKRSIGSSYSRLFSSAMVGGCFVPQFSSTESSIIKYIDPDFSEIEKALSQVDPKIIKTFMRRIFFAKVLYAAGLWRLASIIMEEHVDKNDIEFVHRLNGGEQTFNDYKRTESHLIREITYLSFDYNEDGSASGHAIQNVLNIVIPIDVISAISSAININGLISITKIDDFIERLEKKQEKKNSRNYPEKRRTPWGWTEESNWKQGATTTHTPFGIDFKLSVRELVGR
ncbi:hypothetical protein [Chromobacterium haemolyticum]|nr:hypothetical protein [Chromobacterium haemolyticum]